MPAPVTVRVPGKVNLHLSVGARRPDGFHDVTTVFQAVSLYDDLTASPGPDDITCSVSGEGAGELPTDSDNLAVAAALRLAVTAGVTRGARLHVTKGIPVAGGMAGGSADAAAALVACDALWGTALPRAELLELAGRLGSDVPFAIVGGTALGVGRGEQLTPALARGRFEWVFAVADGGLSTPQVYAETDRLREGRVLPEPRVPDEMMAALRSGDAIALGEAMANDLQPAAVSLRPSLMRTLEVGDDVEALGSVVSGSGPTVAFLARDKEHSLDIAVALSASGTCRSVKRAHGPVGGARLGEER